MKATNRYVIASLIYANYIMQSIVIIIVMQFSFVFIKQLNTDLIGIGFIASGIGIGKVLMMFIGGLFSDRYGRKRGILIAMSFYICFFIGLIFCTNIIHAFLLTILAGMGNAFLDTASMPALTELFPASASSASILIKGFISAGTLILPLLVTFIYEQHLWYGIVLLGFGLFLLLNSILFLCVHFPEKTIIISDKKVDPNLKKHQNSYFTGTPNKYIEGGCLIVMGFTISATFVIIMQWLPDIAMHAVGMDEISAKQLISNYSMGSVIAVLLTACMIKKIVKPIYCIVVFPLLSTMILGLFLLHFTPFMCSVVAVVMGFSAAGGVLQLAVVVMQQVFPTRKGVGVGLMYTLSGLAFLVTPLIIPKLTLFDVRYAILFDFSMALISLLLGCIVFIRINYFYK